jgi:hypothetical protein
MYSIWQPCRRRRKLNTPKSFPHETTSTEIGRRFFQVKTFKHEQKVLACVHKS